MPELPGVEVYLEARLKKDWPKSIDDLETLRGKGGTPPAARRPFTPGS